MAPRPAEALPFDVAVEREKAFLEQVRDMIDDAVQRHTAVAVAEMRETRRAMALVVDRMNNIGNVLVGMQGDLSRCVGWITARALKEDALERKLDQFFELVTPRTTPPSTPPRTD